MPPHASRRTSGAGAASQRGKPLPFVLLPLVAQENNGAPCAQRPPQKVGATAPVAGNGRPNGKPLRLPVGIRGRRAARQVIYFKPNPADWERFAWLPPFRRGRGSYSAACPPSHRRQRLRAQRPLGLPPGSSRPRQVCAFVFLRSGLGFKVGKVALGHRAEDRSHLSVWWSEASLPSGAGHGASPSNRSLAATGSAWNHRLG